ncbi:Na+/H+ antiporter [Nocardiopsis sp. NPDC006139]|uniref:Na+/H+ antiporter n=1 Tax=Nocardiopsis sp. NPDC006139 TaxID=3154578 RepID=UPI0033BA66D8
MGVEEYVVGTLVVVVAVIIGRLIAMRLRIPDAIVLVVLGMALGLLPGVDSLTIAPEIVLLVFLPPLIYNAAFFTSPRDFRELLRPIVVMAVGVTLVTALGLAAVVYFLIPAVSWPAAIALGAAIAPTDAVAASAILKRVGTPRRVLTILEGESLINDAVALTLFSLALTAMSHPLTPSEGVVELAKVVVGGLAFGALVAWLVSWSRRLIEDSSVQLMIVLITPFAAYVPSEMLGFSGVLSAALAGIVLGTRGEGLLPPKVRVTAQTLWQTLVAVLESMLFVLLGLQLDAVITAVREHYSFPRLVLVALLVTVTAVVLRMGLMMVVIPLQRVIPFLNLEVSSFRERVVIGWSGMRGAVSLAIALSLPATVGGEPFTERGGLIFVAGVVVMGTLMGQGLSLPLVLRRLGVGGGDSHRKEFLIADHAMSCAALSKVDELQTSGEVDAGTAESLRSAYSRRVGEVQALLDEDDSAFERAESVKAVHARILDARRDTLKALYREGRIDHAVFQSLSRDMDLGESKGGPFQGG